MGSTSCIFSNLPSRQDVSHAGYPQRQAVSVWRGRQQRCSCALFSLKSLYVIGADTACAIPAPMLGDFYEYEFETKTWTDLTDGTFGSRPPALKLHGMVA
eukprot:1975999-Rhodomonas_salina.1